MNTSPRSIDLGPYYELARRIVPGIEGMAICLSDGAVLSASDENLERQLVHLLETRGDTVDSLTTQRWVPINETSQAICMTLPPDEHGHPLTLVFLVNTTDGNTSGAKTDIYDLLFPLTACIQNDLLLNSELDEMAVELADRYEELNLVYHTDDQVSFFREGEEALTNLVQNCADYLNVEFSALYMRDKGIVITSCSENGHLDVTLLAQHLQDQCYDQVIETADVVVINDPGTEVAAATKPLPCRVIGCPIPGTGSKIDGVLFVANCLSCPAFSNSDKNLLQVMTKKAAKIVLGSWDGLTGLLNRGSFEYAVAASMPELSGPKLEHALLYINIDQLHLINDTLGHEAGDRIIEKTAELVKNEMRGMDIIARIGGDELGILARNCSPTQSESIAKKLREMVEVSHFEWNGETVNPTVSIGIAQLTHLSRSAEEVLKKAVVACDVAKERGRNRVQAYASEDAGLIEREKHMWMVSAVHSALQEDRMELVGQLIEPFASGSRMHVETLLRMRQDGKLLPPNEFLPASERYQLMLKIDEWVISRALETLACMPNPDCVVLSVNLSAQSFSEPKFLDICRALVNQSPVSGDSICFEITETAAVSNMTQAKQFIANLRELGCRFALDDFGAGMSSFGYLKSFDIDYLKIDGALVRDIVKDPVSEAMVASINQIAHIMGHQTIAEYVETPAIMAKLKNMGVDFGQGYAIGKPITLIDILTELTSGSAAGAA